MFLVRPKISNLFNLINLFMLIMSLEINNRLKLDKKYCFSTFI